MQLVLECFTVFEGVLLLQVLCTADGELYIVINTPILLTILKPSPCDWVFTYRNRKKADLRSTPSLLKPARQRCPPAILHLLFS